MHYEWNTFASNWNHGGISCDVHFAGHLRSNRTNVWSDKSNIRNVQSGGARGLELRTAALTDPISNVSFEKSRKLVQSLTKTVLSSSSLWSFCLSNCCSRSVRAVLWSASTSYHTHTQQIHTHTQKTHAKYSDSQNAVITHRGGVSMIFKWEWDEMAKKSEWKRNGVRWQSHHYSSLHSTAWWSTDRKPPHHLQLLRTCRFSVSKFLLLTSSFVNCINSASMSLIYGYKHRLGVNGPMETW